MQKAEPIKRISYRVVDKNPVHIRLHLWVNGGRITSEPVTLRLEEFDDFIGRLKAIPDSEFPNWTEHDYENI